MVPTDENDFNFSRRQLLDLSYSLDFAHTIL